MDENDVGFDVTKRGGLKGKRVGGKWGGGGGREEKADQKCQHIMEFGEVVYVGQFLSAFCGGSIADSVELFYYLVL